MRPPAPDGTAARAALHTRGVRAMSSQRAKPLEETKPEVEAIMEELAAPFEASEVKFKPGVVSGNRALALHFVDARVIQDRLDEVLGVANWQDEYEVLADGSVVCRLRLRLGGEWITKMDVGGPSEQPRQRHPPEPPLR